MGVIFAISPNYLEALYKESRNFEFSLQGYGDIKNSYNGLQGTNARDILGFVFLGDNLPERKSFDKFLQTCNLISANKPKPFIVALCKGTATNNVIDFKKYSNLKFFVVQKIEILTNIVIKEDIFGPILLENYQPYQLEENIDEIQYHSLDTIEYKPIIPSVFYKIFNPVEYHASLQECITADKVYNDFLKDNKLLAECRLVKIKYDFLSKNTYVSTLTKNELKTSLESIEIKTEKIEDVRIYCCVQVVIDKLFKMVNNLGD